MAGWECVCVSWAVCFRLAGKPQLWVKLGQHWRVMEVLRWWPGGLDELLCQLTLEMELVCAGPVSLRLGPIVALTPSQVLFLRFIYVCLFSSHC